MLRTFNVVTTFKATIARFGFGTRAGKIGPRPEQRLELYDFEGCPFCRKVREALTVLNLDAVIYPCPKRGPRFRPKVVEMGGKAQFPYLVDPNTGTAMYESNAIVRYLFETYGSGPVPLMLRLGPLTDLSSSLASLARYGQGVFYHAADPPEQLLELYNYEGSPFCRLVREVLCELEITYLVRNVPHHSPNREAFIALSGKMRVPYLVDPNHDVAMFESADIVRYLRQTYGAA